MPSTGAEGEFEDLCQQYKTWIIQYESDRFASPLYMVWLSDATDEQDKFILSKDNRIVAATTPMDLLNAVKDLEIEPPAVENTREWLIRAYFSEPSPSVVYDIKFLEYSISKKDYNQVFIEEATGFINFFGDLGYQLEDDDFLDLTWDNSVRDLWDFFYDNTFWPRWGNEEAFDEKEVPAFEPDYEELKSDFNLLFREFESRIEVR